MQNNKISKTIKLRKHHGITHINNSLAGRLKQSALPVQCLTVGVATLPSTRIHNVCLQTLRTHYAYFLNYYAKHVTLPHAIFTQTLRKYNYASITQIVYAKYADITQIRLRSKYAIISDLRNYITLILR